MEHLIRSAVIKMASMSIPKAAAKKNQPKSAPAEKAGPTPAAETMRASRGAVDAPGKRHRKPPPQEAINKRMGEPVGKQMGQKSFKVGKSRGRG